MLRSGPQAVLSPVSAPVPPFTNLDPPETNAHLLTGFTSLGSTGDPILLAVDVSDDWIGQPLIAELDEVTRQHDILMYEPGVSFRHSGWKKDRHRVYSALHRTGQPSNRIMDFAQCGKHAYVLQSLDDPDQFVVAGSTCHDRFCLPCGKERSRRIATNVLDKLEHEQARFLTLTLKSDTESLKELITKLYRDFSSLRRTKFWRNKVTGGVAFLEVKWFETTQRWHPHLHCLVQGRYIPKHELAKTWLRITGTSTIVDIRMATDNAIVVHYVTKYATKPLDHSVIRNTDRLDEAVLALKGKRLCLTFGTWRGYKLSAPLDKTQWRNLGLLSEIIKRAVNGNLRDQHILDSLSITYVHSGIPPPSSTARPVFSSVQTQLTIPYRDRSSLLPDAFGTL